MRILVAEDDLSLQHGLHHVLSVAGHQTIVATDGGQADLLLSNESFDLVVLDLGLPVMDGISVLKRMRRRKQSIPVLILTARDGSDERVRGLDAGADDYMSKPFDLPEFEARVRALLRRGQGSQFQLGDLTWSWEQRQADIQGTELTLSKNELIVLEALIQNSGRITSKDALAQRIGSQETQAGDNMVEVYIHRLRRKILNAGVEIRTARGLGYLLIEQKQ